MIYLITTYPPKACGIAVFSRNFTSALQKILDKGSTKKKKEKQAAAEKVKILAMEDAGDVNDEYADEVIYRIQKNSQKDYLQAADFVNVNKPQVCVVEHEFGIFGGENGYFILSFLNRVQTKVVVVFHTILQTPSSHQRLIMKEIANHCHQVVVMSEFGVNYLVKIYGIPREKISYIPHGVPTFSGKKSGSLFGPDAKPGKLLLTFGLLSRNKGLETAILAMRDIVKKFPDIRYLIVGRTHPDVVKHSGEEYRNFLIDLVGKYQLQKNVMFINSFLVEEQIIEYVKSSDIYVTPYQDPNQITSGTLSYAIGSGIPFVSTPYRYAEEKAQYGCGGTFPFHDSRGMAELVIDVLEHPEKLKAMKQKCLEVSKSMSWENVALEYSRLFDKIVSEPASPGMVQDEYKFNLTWMPNMDLSHVYRLTDDVGILQHARFTIPRFHDGYCVDDNCRALLLMVMAHRLNRNPIQLEKMVTYLAFIDYMINEDGSIRNFMSFDRKFLDGIGSDDSYGRTIWAIGYLLAFPPTSSLGELAENIFLRMREYLPTFIERSSLRGLANAIVGVTYFLVVFPDDQRMISLLRDMADRLLESYRKNCHDDWEWFEEKMSYDNALLPLALIRSHEFLKDQEYFDVAKKSSEFLEKAMLIDGFFRPIGNIDWYQRDQAPSEYDQQPLEIMAISWLNYHMYRNTKDEHYLKSIRKAFRWFLGDNTVGVSLYDYETKGCRDGLEKGGINRNQGAESTLSFWISYCLVFLVLELESQYID